MEQKPSGENNLSWREAIIEVLKKSSKPMSSVEIVAAIKERKLRNVTGNTPEATVGAQIYTSMKRDGEPQTLNQIIWHSGSWWLILRRRVNGEQ